MTTEDLIYDLIVNHDHKSFRQIETENLEKIDQFIETGNIDNSVTTDNKSILLELVPRGHKARAIKLYHKITNKTFFDAIIAGDMAFIKLKLQENPSIINEKSPLNGLTALHLACGFSNDPKLVQFLVENGAKLDVYSDPGLIDGLSPIISASLGGNFEIMKYLLEQGADPNSQEIETKTTSLHIATAHGRINMCKILLEYGADPNFQTSDGRSPIDNVRKKQDQELMGLFQIN